MNPTFRRELTRRGLLKSTAALAAASTLPNWFAQELLAADEPAKPKSPNDLPAFALIGCGGRGRADAREAMPFGRLMAVCDVDEHHRETAVAELAPDRGDQIKRY